MLIASRSIKNYASLALSFFFLSSAFLWKTQRDYFKCDYSQFNIAKNIANKLKL